MRPYDEDAGKANLREIERHHRIWTNKVNRCIKYVRIFSIIKIILATLIVFAYFFMPDYFSLLVVIGVVFSLIFPHGYKGEYLKELIELKIIQLEQRVILNATESNYFFHHTFQRIKKLEKNSQEAEELF